MLDDNLIHLSLFRLYTITQSRYLFRQTSYIYILLRGTWYSSQTIATEFLFEVNQSRGLDETLDSSMGDL